MIELDTQDVLLTSNKLLSIQIETLAKNLDAREVAQLPTKEQVKYMATFTRQYRNP